MGYWGSRPSAIWAMPSRIRTPIWPSRSWMPWPRSAQAMRSPMWIVSPKRRRQRASRTRHWKCCFVWTSARSGGTRPTSTCAPRPPSPLRRANCFVLPTIPGRRSRSNYCARPTRRPNPRNYPKSTLYYLGFRFGLRCHLALRLLFDLMDDPALQRYQHGIRWCQHFHFVRPRQVGDTQHVAEIHVRDVYCQVFRQVFRQAPYLHGLQCLLDKGRPKAYRFRLAMPNQGHMDFDGLVLFDFLKCDVQQPVRKWIPLHPMYDHGLVPVLRRDHQAQQSCLTMVLDKIVQRLRLLLKVERLFAPMLDGDGNEPLFP